MMSSKDDFAAAHPAMPFTEATGRLQGVDLAALIAAASSAAPVLAEAADQQHGLQLVRLVAEARHTGILGTMAAVVAAAQRRQSRMRRLVAVAATLGQTAHAA
jgi:hypothetical protein